MSDLSRSLNVVPAGLMAYDVGLALQERLHAKVVAGELEASAIVLEHTPVLTFGKNADRRHLLFAASVLTAQGIMVADTDRGGEVTAHEPGQLVVYPILKLSDFGLSPRSYVALIEDAVIRTVQRFGIEATTDPEHPGVWVGREKVCAIGVRVKSHVSMHGLALNIENSMDLFGKIVPCGIAGRGVTSMTRLLGRPVSVDAVAPILIRELATGLGVPEERVRTRPDLAIGS